MENWKECPHFGERDPETTDDLEMYFPQCTDTNVSRPAEEADDLFEQGGKPRASLTSTLSTGAAMLAYTQQPVQPQRLAHFSAL